MNKIKIYVVTHKSFDRVTTDDIYTPIVVGAVKNNVDYSCKDNMGEENISNKNNDYCELTGQYWIWKNDSESDIVGLTHYRRYFYKSKHILNQREIEDALTYNDIIIAKKTFLTRSIYDIYKQSELWIYLLKLNEILKKDYPNYYKNFDKVLKNNYTYPCNMLICKKDLFDAYSKWLFEVLGKLESTINEENIKKVARAYGFLSENMLIAYILTNNLKYVTFPVYNTEIKRTKQIYTNIINMLYGSMRVFLSIAERGDK